MGYFEGLAEGSFKSDSQGNILFYKWGVLGKAYILPDKQKEAEIKSFVMLFHKVSLASIIGVGIVFHWLYTLIIAVPLLLWYLIKINNLTKGLSISTEKFSLKESYANSAKKHNKATLWCMLISSFLFVLSGVFIISRARDSKEILIGSSSILFFGIGLIVAIYMLKKKRT